MKLYSEYTLEELLGFVRAGEGCEGLYDAIAEKVALLRPLFEQYAVVVEAAKDLEDDCEAVREGQPKLDACWSCECKALCEEVRALAAREEAGQ